MVAFCEPEPGPKLNLATPGVGLPAASNVIATAPGASTEMGTVLPFSAISGAVRLIPSPEASEVEVFGTRETVYRQKILLHKP